LIKISGLLVHFSDESDGSALTTGGIVGIVVGIVILVAILLVIAVICSRRRNEEYTPTTGMCIFTSHPISYLTISISKT